ncbi:MAG: sigma-70 family RNA polymerase sigma factor [Fuerstiella sp.]
MPLTEKDRLLVNELLSGKSGAWQTFVDRYTNLIVHVINNAAHAHSIKLQQDDIDDLTADVFATLLERNLAAVRAFRGRSSFATYLVVIVRRVVLKKLTQRRYLQAFGHVQAHVAHLEEASDHRSVDAVDRKDEVDSLMSSLPASLRPIAKMFYLDQLSYRQIASKLGRPMNSIGPALSTIREILTAGGSASSRS